MSADILITVVHPTARVTASAAFPEGWREAARVMFERADNPDRVQYITVVHESRWDRDELSGFSFGQWKNFDLLKSTGRDCVVDQANTALPQCKGELLLMMQDDMFAPQGWDTLILENFRDETGALSLDRDAVLHVSSGVLRPDGWELPARNDTLFNPQIYTKARADRLGYLGYPEYISAFSDDDLSEHARLDGVVIDARHIVFEHRHPIFGGAVDTVYQDENSREAYRVGREVLARRRAAGFGVLPKESRGLLGRIRNLWNNNSTVDFSSGGARKNLHYRPDVPQRRDIACCLPGEGFSSMWAHAWTFLFGGMLMGGWAPRVQFGYSTSVHVARMMMARQTLELNPRADLVLWIDDDNLLTFEQFSLLVKDLDDSHAQDPNIQMVVGWCWMKCESPESEPLVSCGRMGANGAHAGIVYDSMMAGACDLIEIEWSGFPVVLMKREALERAGGPGAFLPYVDPDSPFGFLAEDQAFCRRYREAGGRMLLDRRVHVPHLKLQPAQPQGAPAAAASLPLIDSI